MSDEYCNFLESCAVSSDVPGDSILSASSSTPRRSEEDSNPTVLILSVCDDFEWHFPHS